jgi:lipopolysaccharide export system protein LptA
MKRAAGPRRAPRGLRALPRAAWLVLAGLLLGPAAARAADPITFSADSVQASLAKDRESTVLSGKASVKTGSISIVADRIELFGKDFTYLQCSGSVRVVDTDKKLRLESPSLYYDRSKKLLRAQGPSVLQDDRNKLVLKAEWIESDNETEITLAEIAVRIVKDKIACRSEYALYKRKDNILELTGAPSASKEGDSYEASRIVVNTDTEDIQLEGEVKGSVVDKKAEPAKGSAEASSEKASPEKAPLPPPDKGQPASGPGGAE